jgi:hypothetical protein
MRQSQETGCIARAHLQRSGSQDLHGAPSRSGCPSVFFIGLLAKTRVSPNRPCRGSRQLHVVHDGGLAGIVDEQPQCLSNAAPSLVDGAPLRVAAAYTAHGSHPPARLVSLVGHAIRFHGFFNHPFPRHGSKSRSMRRSRPARCLHRHERVRSSHSDRSRCVDASPVAGSRRNRRTSGCAEVPSPSQDQDSRGLACCLGH